MNKQKKYYKVKGIKNQMNFQIKIKDKTNFSISKLFSYVFE